MIRVASEGLLLFLLPFAAYVAFLLARRRLPFLRDNWTQGPLPWLVGLGIGCLIVGLLVLGLFGERRGGAYVPAHIDHGQLVPGQMAP